MTSGSSTCATSRRRRSPPRGWPSSPAGPACRSSPPARGHQRHQRGHNRALQRVAARRARRPAPTGAVGIGLAPGVRSRAGPRLDHQVSRDGDGPRSACRSRRAARDRAHPAPGTGVLRLPARRRLRRGPAEVPAVVPTPARPEPDPDARRPGRRGCRAAPSAGVVAGSDVYWDAAAGLQAAVEALRVPTFVNGLGRGCLPLITSWPSAAPGACSRPRPTSWWSSGTPLDFRLSFGRFGDAQVVHVVDSPAAGRPRRVRGVAGGDLRRSCAASPTGRRPRRPRALDRAAARRRVAARRTPTCSAPTPIRSSPPGSTASSGRSTAMRWSSATAATSSPTPASTWTPTSPAAGSTPVPTAASAPAWATPMAARLTHPDRQVVVMLGDGAAGFSLMDVDTLVRHELPVVIVVGNNGIWGLEKHPMQDPVRLRRGRRPPARLPLRRGGRGPRRGRRDGRAPARSAPRSTRFAAGVPYLVNVLTDPADVYPRRSTSADSLAGPAA